MRWFVEVSPTGDVSKSSRYCVEAKQWQAALQETRKSLGDIGPLSKFAIELLDNGYRAVDPATKTRYTVAKAPDDAELTPLNGNSSPAAEAKQGPKPSEKPAPKLAPEPTATEGGPVEAKPAKTEPAKTEPAKTEPAKTEPASAKAGSVDFHVVRKRSEDPSERTPISYREFAYAVKPGTTRADAERLIQERFREVKSSLDGRPPGKFVQLAVFDHVFEKRPANKPLVTLAWKDWRGDAVLSFPRGTDEAPISVAPPSDAPPESLPPYSGPGIDAAPVSMSDPTVAAALANEAVEASDPIEVSEEPPVSSRSAASAQPNAVAHPATAGAEAPAAKGEKGPASKGKKKKKKRGESTTTHPDTPSQKVVTRRREGKDDLISELFETMHDLHFMPDIMTGADFMLDVLAKTLPAEATVVHVFDINTRRFVVVRARGDSADQVLMHATPDSDELFRDVLRAPRSVRFSKDNPPGLGEHWQLLGLVPEAVMLGPVRQGGRYLGV
ncbi:MAG: hypothetical protein KC766_19490, partial [Myxococcales bacterium]|nr:hypothetical protein [Myxococcales bacterium]